MYIRLPESLVYFFAYLSDFISSLLKVKLPITVDRVNALTSRAKFCQKRFEEVYGHSYKTSMKEALKECIDFWSEEKNVSIKWTEKLKKDEISKSRNNVIFNCFSA